MGRPHCHGAASQESQVHTQHQSRQRDLPLSPTPQAPMSSTNATLHADHTLCKELHGVWLFYTWAPKQLPDPLLQPKISSFTYKLSSLKPLAC